MGNFFIYALPRGPPQCYQRWKLYAVLHISVIILFTCSIGFSATHVMRDKEFAIFFTELRMLLLPRN